MNNSNLTKSSSLINLSNFIESSNSVFSDQFSIQTDKPNNNICDKYNGYYGYYGYYEYCKCC